jgi:outer membrane protein assembly factor BamB
MCILAGIMLWRRPVRYLVVSLLVLWCGISSSAAADWPGFRGPFGNGVCLDKTFPLKWGPKENLAWKAPLPGPGTSSPVICGEQVFLTCFTGKKAAELVRHVLCFDRSTGQKRWQKDFPAPLPENDYKAQLLQHGFTTSTPVTDGKRLFVYFGRGGLLAFDLDGNLLWQADLGDTISVFGSGASPIVLGDMVIVNASMESRKLVALEKSSGKIRWKSEIDGMSWCTPVVVDADAGKKEIVLNVGAGLYGFDADKGTELWSVDIVAGYNSSTPVTRDGIVYVINQGVGEKETVAVRAGGRGDVTKTHVLWRQAKAGASYCSPLLKNDRLFYFSGQAIALATADGHLVTKKSLEGVTNLYGSPILAGDKIILFTRSNGAYVLTAADKLDVLAHNLLDDDSTFNASPALVNGQIFMRSNQFLYCIGSSPTQK